MANYIARLDKALCRRLSLKTREQVLADYREYYDELCCEGYNDKQIEEKLGSPEEIIKEILAEQKSSTININRAVLFRSLLAAALVISIAANILEFENYRTVLSEPAVIFLLMCGQTAASSYLLYIFTAHLHRNGAKFVCRTALVSSVILGLFYSALGLLRIYTSMSSDPLDSSAITIALLPLAFSVVICAAAVIITAVYRRKHESAV